MSVISAVVSGLSALQRTASAAWRKVTCPAYLPDLVDARPRRGPVRSPGSGQIILPQVSPWHPVSMLLTRQRLLAWLRSIDDDAEHPERHNALWDGSRLAVLAEQEGLLDAGPQGRIELARLLGQLKEDGWITWNWQQGPPGTRDADEPPVYRLAGEHVSRMQEIRVLPAGYQVAAGTSTAPAAGSTEYPRLEPEQEQLLITLVEASRDVPRDQREFFLIRTFGGDEIQGGGLASSIEVSVSDLEYLGEYGLLRIKAHPDGTQATFTVAPQGIERYEAIHRRAATPLQQVDARTHSYLESPEFRSHCPAAFQRWSEAVELLWRNDSNSHLSAIGHKAREAMQEFATALVERHRPPDPNPDPTKTLDRVSAVLQMYHARLGERRLALLNGLFAYWRAAVALVQRQEHGGQKGGEPLGWEDGRRVVFQTANAMVELHRATEQAARGPNASALSGLNGLASGGSVAAADTA